MREGRIAYIFFGGETREEMDHLEDLGGEGRIIL
jgi:hypothetical protein